MSRILFSAFLLATLGLMGVGAAPNGASAATTCLYPGIPQTWTTDTPDGTVTYTLGTDGNGQTVLNVQAPDGTATIETIAPCGPGTTAYPPVPVVAAPAPVVVGPQVIVLPSVHHHHHRR